MSGNEVAPEGQVFVCATCGKRSRDRFGNQKISRGWDESCMLNAVLCYDDPIEERRVNELKTGFAWRAVNPAE